MRWFDMTPRFCGGCPCRGERKGLTVEANYVPWIVAGVAAAWSTCDVSRSMAGAITSALDDALLSRKAVALAAGLKESRLSVQLQAGEPLNIYRLALVMAVYPEFGAALVRRLGELYGLRVYSTREVPELIDGVRELLGWYRRRPMARRRAS